MQNNDNLIWIDLEMTGLNPDSDSILEIALVVTNNNLDILDKTTSIAIYQTDEVLAKMNDWCLTQHNKSGLINRVKNSNIDLIKAESVCLEFLSKWVAKKTSPMCGNTVCQDRRFLINYMPDLADYFHYRHIDVSTIKELAARLSSVKILEKQSLHLALDDVLDSINELKYYRDNFFKI